VKNNANKTIIQSVVKVKKLIKIYAILNVIPKKSFLIMESVSERSEIANVSMSIILCVV